MIRCSCPHCRTILGAPVERAGMVVACSRCGKRLRLPAAPARPVTRPATPKVAVLASPPNRLIPVTQQPKLLALRPQPPGRAWAIVMGLIAVLGTAAGLVAAQHFLPIRFDIPAVALGGRQQAPADQGNVTGSDKGQEVPPAPPTPVIPPPDAPTPPVKTPGPMTDPPMPPVNPPAPPPDPPQPAPDLSLPGPRAAGIDLATLYATLSPIKAGGPLVASVKCDGARVAEENLAKVFIELFPTKGTGPLAGSPKTGELLVAKLDPPPVKPPNNTDPPPVKIPGGPDLPAGKTIRDTYPVPFDTMKKTLAALAKPPAGLAGTALERQMALQRAQSYRYLCGLAYKNLKLDDQCNECAELAAKICEKLKGLTHNPTNPGLPEADYQKGLQGAKSSNLAAAPQATLPVAVDLWMNDSDAGNIKTLGHRRWILNPFLGKTGFGKAGFFAAMWILDFSNKNPPPFDWICYPSQGYMPVEYFGPNHAWSVMVNSNLFKIANDKAVDVKVFPVDLTGKKLGKPLDLNYKDVTHSFSGGTGLCIVFRPNGGGAAAEGNIYQVEITGVSTKDGEAITIRYPVEFVSLADGPVQPKKE